MYGGLQMGLGVVCLLGVLRSEWETTALRTLFVLAAGLLERTSAGLVVDGSASAYRVGLGLRGGDDRS